MLGGALKRHYMRWKLVTGLVQCSESAREKSLLRTESLPVSLPVSLVCESRVRSPCSERLHDHGASPRCTTLSTRRLISRPWRSPPLRAACPSQTH